MCEVSFEKITFIKQVPEKNTVSVFQNSRIVYIFEIMWMFLFYISHLYFILKRQYSLIKYRVCLKSAFIGHSWILSSYIFSWSLHALSRCFLLCSITYSGDSVILCLFLCIIVVTLKITNFSALSHKLCIISCFAYEWYLSKIAKIWPER